MMKWDGLLLVNKPEGVTSHAVVQLMKERLGTDKAGHLGTLDPIATGVFPVCLGRATRLASFYMGTDKGYLVAIRFGFFTSTDDREGQPEKPHYKIKFTEPQLKECLETFRGEFEQKPPAFSAKKVKGQKSYKLARRGVKLNLPTQRVNIYDIRLITFQEDTAVIDVHCSSGTYVRSIARELGIRLRCGAHVRDLARTRFGVFKLDNCCKVSDSIDKLKRSFIPIEKMLSDLPEVTLESDGTRRILTGSAVDMIDKIDNNWVRIFTKDGTLIALARVDNTEKRLQPKIVFN